MIEYKFNLVVRIISVRYWKQILILVLDSLWFIFEYIATVLISKKDFQRWMDPSLGTRPRLVFTDWVNTKQYGRCVCQYNRLLVLGSNYIIVLLWIVSFKVTEFCWMQISFIQAELHSSGKCKFFEIGNTSWIWIGWAEFREYQLHHVKQYKRG